jgi:hypothetical protein
LSISGVVVEAAGVGAVTPSPRRADPAVPPRCLGPACQRRYAGPGRPVVVAAVAATLQYNPHTHWAARRMTVPITRGRSSARVCGGGGLKPLIPSKMP